MTISNWMCAENIVITFLVAALPYLVINFLLSWRKSCNNSDPTKYPEFIKYLDPVERLFACMHDRRNSVLNFTVIVGSERKLSFDEIKQSCAEWMKIRRILRARVVTYSAFYRHAYFLETDPEELIDMHVMQVDDDDWKYLHEKLMMDSFDSTSGLLWRLTFAPNINPVLINETETTDPHRDIGNTSLNKDSTKHRYENVLVFRFLHCFADGVGAMILMKDFIDVLNSVLIGKAITPDNETMSQQFYECIGNPSLTQTMSVWLLSLPVPFFGNILEKMIKRPNLPEESDVLALGVDVKDGGKWRVEAIHLTEQETSHLLESCHVHGCTLQGVLEAAVGTALTQVLLEHRVGNTSTRINFNIPVDLRRRLSNPSISSSAVGNCFGDTNHSFLFDIKY